MAVPQQRGGAAETNFSKIGKDAEIERLNAELTEHQQLKRHILELLDHKDAEIRDYMDKMAAVTSSASVNEARLQEIELELIRYRAKHNEDCQVSLKMMNIRMEIFVIDLQGRTYSLKVDATDKVETLKAMMQYKTGIPQDQQRFIFAGKQLEDGKCVGDYNIIDGLTLHLISSCDRMLMNVA